ncbi:MAG: HAD family hydrolase [Alphaproteobacteria bacterium]|nr:HAD family hydrolase [Alphaproteobacteria bacterium]
MNKNYVILVDWDGNFADSNGVKDARLNTFCKQEFGEIPVEKKSPKILHRELHGRPMGEIFQRISFDIYEKEISYQDGIVMTDRLNEFILPFYVARPIFPGAYEFYKRLKDMGYPVYILTGMEPYMIEKALEHHKITDLFDGIYGAPATKEENIVTILEKHPGAKIIASGDAMSEYRATMAYPGTIFLAFDMENREKRVFPEEVKVYTSYNEEVWNDLMEKME